MSFKSLLNQTCAVYRKTRTENDYGQSRNTWVLVTGKSAVECNIQYLNSTSAKLEQDPSGLMNKNEYIGFFEKDAGILSGDKIVWEGITLYIKVPNSVFGGIAKHHIEAFLSLQEL
jgi:hypothetical protein